MAHPDRSTPYRQRYHLDSGRQIARVLMCIWLSQILAYKMKWWTRKPPSKKIDAHLTTCRLPCSPAQAKDFHSSQYVKARIGLFICLYVNLARLDRLRPSILAQSHNFTVPSKEQLRISPLLRLDRNLYNQDSRVYSWSSCQTDMSFWKRRSHLTTPALCSCKWATRWPVGFHSLNIS